jgi:hypothetical protein
MSNPRIQRIVNGLVSMVFGIGCGFASAQGVTNDPAGDCGDASADLVSVASNVNRHHVQFLIETAGPNAFANTQVLVDTDRNSTTGFSLGEQGFDLLVEGANVFAFEGSDQSSWQWRPIGQAARVVDKNRLKLAVAHDLLAVPHELIDGHDVDYVVRTLTTEYAEVDRLPDAGAIRLDLKPNAKEETVRLQPGEAADPSGDAIDAGRDVTSVKISQHEDRLVVEVEVREPGDFAQLLVLFDTDNNGETGYRSTAADFGFDALLSGGQLLQFGGQKQDVWAWETKEEAKVSVAERRFRAEFDAAALNGSSARVVVMQMSADWQTVVDLAPDDGAIDLQIDTSKTNSRRKTQTKAAPHGNRHLPPRQRVAQSESFYCYYGSGKVAELSHYDVVIAHSPQMQPASIAELKELGVVMVGYLTVGEDDKLRKGNGEGPGGYASWYLDEDNDGQPDQNGIWKSYYADANDPNWLADRVAEAKRLVSKDGYDGIFLDTIDTASAFPQTAPGMVKLVEALRSALPDAPIVLNQGFSLLDRLAPFADGLMLESFTATYDFETREYVLHSPSSLDWTRGVANRVIAPVLAKHSLKVFVLDYAKPFDKERIQMAADRAATFGYLFAAGPITLDAVYERGLQGNPDPKWLEKQATPEAMKHTLTQEANGFPAGTVVVPSGCYGGYGVAAVVDGIADRESLYWSKAAWASAEDGEEAWIEFRFPRPLASGKLRIQWALDGGKLYASTRYRVEVLQADAWILVERVQANSEAATDHVLPDRPYDAIRILQTPSGGSTQRPNLMWIAQIERSEES